MNGGACSVVFPVPRIRISTGGYVSTNDRSTRNPSLTRPRSDDLEHVEMVLRPTVPKRYGCIPQVNFTFEEYARGRDYEAVRQLDSIGGDIVHLNWGWNVAL